MSTILGTISAEEFLRDYWQKKPLLIRNALPSFSCPITGDELAGLACEEQVESRIVLENLKGKPWQLKNGPFDESIFNKLPKENWTLLVQSVDHWVPELSSLLDQFRFIPNWRLDDIMASFAPKGGSVGPHFDYYDVFLLQAQGQRRWKLGQHCDHDTPRLSGTPLRILSDFQQTDEWVLNPGDMLYLPPQIAHYGIAENDCITLSVGFRSPTDDELWSSFTDYVCHHIPADQHLDDPDMETQENPGLIKQDLLNQVRNRFIQHINDPKLFHTWFGKFLTEPKSEHTVAPADEEPLDEDDIRFLLEEQHPLRWNEGSRFSYSLEKDTVLFFCDGECYELPTCAEPFAALLCQQSQIDVSALQSSLELSQDNLALLAGLCNKGSLYWEDF